jgi:hypothetical protein
MLEIAVNRGRSRGYGLNVARSRRSSHRDRRKVAGQVFEGDRRFDIVVRCRKRCASTSRPSNASRSCCPSTRASRPAIARASACGRGRSDSFPSARWRRSRRGRAEPDQPRERQATHRRRHGQRPRPRHRLVRRGGRAADPTRRDPSRLLDGLGRTVRAARSPRARGCRSSSPSRCCSSSAALRDLRHRPDCRCSCSPASRSRWTGGVLALGRAGHPLLDLGARRIHRVVGRRRAERLVMITFIKRAARRRTTRSMRRFGRARLAACARADDGTRRRTRLLPMALATGGRRRGAAPARDGGDRWDPVVDGLTLLVLPVLYSLFEGRRAED